jgi:ABC-2 type transport system ATP-binding protein
MILHDLCFRQNGFQLEPVTYTFEPSALYFFIGANGAGKSTLFSLLTGFRKPDQGSVEIQGLTDPWEYRKHIAIAFDDSYYNPNLSGWDNLVITCYRRGINSQKLTQLIEGFHLQDGIKKKVKTYSFGMKKKLALIGAFVVDTSVYPLCG